jgi:glycosyltransferase involved in cell wall biosynthesis
VSVKPSVTVCLAVRDSEKYIESCVRSLLAQTIRDFEIVVVEDPPYDRTKKILYSFKDRRIVYSRNPNSFGIYKTRNICVEQAKGNYLFFTDDDCVVSKDWIEQGLKLLARINCVGVEGKTYYVSEEYEPTFSDRIIQNKKGGEFMTCNMAYKKSTWVRIGRFDERYSHHGDRDFALRSKRLGKIFFNPRMIVYHQRSVMRPRQFVRTAKNIRNQVLLCRKFPEEKTRLRRIVHPLNLMATIFPPLVIGSLIRNRYKTKEDFALFPYVYLQLVYERLSLWNECAKQRVFLI